MRGLSCTRNSPRCCLSTIPSQPLTSTQTSLFLSQCSSSLGERWLDWMALEKARWWHWILEDQADSLRCELTLSLNQLCLLQRQAQGSAEGIRTQLAVGHLLTPFKSIQKVLSPEQTASYTTWICSWEDAQMSPASTINKSHCLFIMYIFVTTEISYSL